MKPVFLLTFLVALSVKFSAQIRSDIVMNVDSVSRQFIVMRPSGQTPSGGYPLVFMFHGTSQDGEKFYNDSQWKEKGETEKIITVFPTALRYCVDEDGSQRTTTKWHNGELEEIACPGQYLKDDVHFVRMMIDTIKARYPINARRIYASGFSNGAGFTSRLAMQMSSVFSAIGICGGTLSDKDSINPPRNMPVWFVLGTKDDKWLANFTGLGITEFPFNDSTLAMLSRSINRFLVCENLTQMYDKTEVGRLLHYVFKTPASPEPTYEYRYTLIDNMFHVYPDGSNVPFVAANFFWDFFNQYLLPVKVEKLPSAPDELTIYPNPAKNFLVIDGSGEITLSLFNTLGQKVFSAQTLKGMQIQLPKLTTGLYFAQVLSGKILSHKMITIQ